MSENDNLQIISKTVDKNDIRSCAIIVVIGTDARKIAQVVNQVKLN